MGPFLQPESQSCGFYSFQPSPSPAIPLFLFFFFSPGSGQVWTHSPTDRAVFLGRFCCLPAIAVLEQAASGIFGPFPFPSFWLYTCFTCFRWDPKWQSRGTGGREGKEKVALKVTGFFCFALLTACKRYRVMPLTLSHAPGCLPPPQWRRNSLQKVFHWLCITHRLERDRNISHWQGLKVLEVGVFPSQGAGWQKVTKLHYSL